MKSEIEAAFAWQRREAVLSDRCDMRQRELFVSAFKEGYESRVAYEKLIPPHALANMDRDKARSESANSGRFEVLGFPAYHGSPQRTDFRLVAYALAAYRILFCNYMEVRVIDMKTGRHRVW